jgi:hypothetical protein
MKLLSLHLPFFLFRSFLSSVFYFKSRNDCEGDANRHKRPLQNSLLQRLLVHDQTIGPAFFAHWYSVHKTKSRGNVYGRNVWKASRLGYYDATRNKWWPGPLNHALGVWKGRTDNAHR